MGPHGHLPAVSQDGGKDVLGNGRSVDATDRRDGDLVLHDGVVEEVVGASAVQLEPAQATGDLQSVARKVKGVQDLDIRMVGESCGNLVGVVAGLLAYVQPRRHCPHLTEQVVGESLGAQNLDCVHAVLLSVRTCGWLIIAQTGVLAKDSGARATRTWLRSRSKR